MAHYLYMAKVRKSNFSYPQNQSEQSRDMNESGLDEMYHNVVKLKLNKIYSMPIVCLS